MHAPQLLLNEEFLKCYMIAANESELYHGAVIKNWSDYIEQNKPDMAIREHLHGLTGAHYPNMVNTISSCIHHKCSSIESCVDRLIAMMINPQFALSNMSLSKEFFHNDPAGKKLCNQCILLFMIKTNQCQNIIDYFYSAYCPPDYTNPCIYYFTRIILAYPTVIKYLLNNTKNIDTLCKMLLFYFGINIKCINFCNSETYINPKEGYKITKNSIIKAFIFEYNLGLILTLFVAFIPYFKRHHLQKLIKLQLPRHLIAFISKSKYSKLKHIQSSLDIFYQLQLQKVRKHYDNIYPSSFPIKSNGNGLVLHVTQFQGDSDNIKHGNPVFCRLIHLYSFFTQKMERFKNDNDAQFVDGYNLLYELSCPRLTEYQNISFLDMVHGNISENDDLTVTKQYKLHYFVHWIHGSRLFSVKRDKKEQRKLIKCSNGKCRKSWKCALKLCKGCKLTMYCSRKCQKYDWMESHRLYCKRIRSLS